MPEPIEKQVPSTNPWLLKASLGLLAVVCPVLLAVLGQGIVSGDTGDILGGAYGTAASALSAYLIARSMRNPDRLTITDSGFTYKFLNITFRVGWEDVEQISLKDSKIIQVRLHDPRKVAFRSLIGRPGPWGRTQFNPYVWTSLRRFARFKRQWPKDNQGLASLLEEAGRTNGFHIAIPVFESAEEAERLVNEMQRLHAAWRPSYEPLSLTAPDTVTQGIEESIPRQPERERQ